MTEPTSKSNWDYLLLLTTLSLVGLGLVMVLSSSSLIGQERHGDPYFFFRPQVVYAILGLAIMFLARKIPYQVFLRLAYPLLLLSIAGLVLVFVPGIGHRAGGANRWLDLGPVSFQPSELTKLVWVIFLAYSLAAKQEQIKSFFVGFLPNLAIFAVLGGLVVMEPDLGSAVVLAILAGFMFFIAGVRFSYLFSLVLAGVPVVYFLIIKVPYRLKRILAFMSPWDDPLGTGYHIIHSFLAFASGGLSGLGPGGGRQKLFFLPEPHTDFIFSVVGEELGFVGVTLAATLFLVLVWRGIYIALNAFELQGSYLAFGLTMVIGIQAFMNMSVALGLLPTKGLILPFFSYGGSAMVVNFACVGIIMNVASQGRREAVGKAGRRG